MNSPETHLIKDTVLHGGLLAAAGAWLILSVVQGPLEQRAQAATMAATAAQAGQRCLAVTPPVAAGRADHRV